jgi:hypothetical protein
MKLARLSSWDVIYTLNMAIACAISYWVMTQSLISIINKDTDLLGGMWAAVATVFVFRTTRENSWSAGVARLIATSVSFALCLLCLDHQARGRRPDLGCPSYLVERAS